jgi:hypothetical protein
MILHSWGRVSYATYTPYSTRVFLARLTRSDTIRVNRPDHSVRSEVLSPTPHRDGRATTSPLYSYVRGLYRTDWHVTFHVHLFGGPGETHTHSSLTRISFNAHKIHFGVLCKPLFPSFISSFCSSESSTLLPRRAASRLSKKAYGRGQLFLHST